ncbi:hypothetical protein L596_004470 [Steinernema carpocapsae]|uniref:Nerve growth factor-related domain-containing protein n=1 Tax=Steinernema carpocapsae TaxID=34508 RepID=A0A4U8UZH7_STECR|nr:hypothetical protein L596_004470 [Steinernema carpocapsae]
MAYKALLYVMLTSVALLSAEELLVEQKVDVCEQTAQWEFLEETETIDKRTVSVIQRPGQNQPFFVVRCNPDKESRPCDGVTNRSGCETRFNIVPALVENEATELGMEWAMIRVPGQCVCSRFVNVTISV